MLPDPAVGAGVDAGADAGGYDYTQMPNAGIDMAFGFSTPTDYVNCQNQSLPGMPNPGEDYPRGTPTWAVLRRPALSGAGGGILSGERDLRLVARAD